MPTIFAASLQPLSPRLPLAAVLLLGSVLAGCGKTKPVVQPGDEKEAIAVTTSCLEAWKQGNMSGLATATPPIRFTDDDLIEGYTLEAFQVSEKTSPDAVGRLRVEAQLKLRDLRGNVAQRNAAYQVTLRPVPLVFRADQ